MSDAMIDEILAYWFDGSGSARTDLWFVDSDEVVDEIRQRFGALLEPAGAGALDDWAGKARGRLALIIVLDQFSRALYRGSAQAFAHDPKAQSLCQAGIELGHDQELPLLYRWFFYMPLEHAEDMALQDQSVRCIQALFGQAPRDKRQIYEGALNHAIRHRAVIERFQRFPERNQLLGRRSTAKELAYLGEGDWT